MAHYNYNFVHWCTVLYTRSVSLICKIVWLTIARSAEFLGISSKTILIRISIKLLKRIVYQGILYANMPISPSASEAAMCRKYEMADKVNTLDLL